MRGEPYLMEGAQAGHSAAMTAQAQGQNVGSSADRVGTSDWGGVDSGQFFACSQGPEASGAEFNNSSEHGNPGEAFTPSTTRQNARQSYPSCPYCVSLQSGSALPNIQEHEQEPSHARCVSHA